MGIEYTWDVEKTIEVLLYIAERCPDQYTALKVLYFADRIHLERYGRLICGDSYVAMRYGPVPSGAYDLVKLAGGRRYLLLEKLSVEEAFSLQGNSIVPHRPPNLEYLSESDIECLDEAIERFGSLSFSALKKASHADPAYQGADRNDFISLETIVKTLPDGELLLEYLTDN